MNIKPILAATAIATCFSLPIAQAVETEFYGSLRLGVEAVSPDNNAGSFDDYVGFRDAYSRIGFKMTEKLASGTTAMFQIESPLDLANQGGHSPWSEQDTMRIFKAQLSGGWGTAWYGRGWMPYYNNIAYPVDYFSSYYSGWATYTSFRKEETLAYSTPSFGGFSAAFATSNDNGSNSDNRNQAALSFAANGLTIAVGIDDMNDANNSQLHGLAVSYSTGPWYLAAKLETFDSDKTTAGYGEDGTSASNVLVQYALDDKNTVRAMVAQVDNYGEDILHLGWDHQYTKALKVFAEYYQEDTTAVISDERTSTFGSGDFFSAADNGGQAFTVGARYDF